MEHRRLRPALVAAAALLVLGVWRCWGAPAPPPGERHATAVASAPSRVPAPPPATDGQQLLETQSRQHRSATAAPQRQPGPAGDALAAYLASAIYPPNSRPLSLDQPDLIHPNRRHEALRSSRHDPSVRVRFTANAFWVTGERPLAVWLEAYRGDAPLLPVVEDAQLAMVTAAGQLGASLPLRLAPAGERQLATLQLDQLVEADEPVRLRFWCRYRLPGGEPETRAFQVVFNPTRALPARFDGRFEEAVRDGSLCIDVGVEVTAAGYYLIDGNLWAGEAPVGWTRFKGELAAGPQQVPLCFFGKVLVDKGLPGPYRLAQLRGARYRPSEEPDMQQMEWRDDAYVTQPLPLSSFSSAAYDSSHKQRKIGMLQATQAANP